MTAFQASAGTCSWPPDHSPPRSLSAILPQTNCKQCGEATCLAFAVGLLQQQRSLAECPPLQADRALGDRRATLEAML